MPEIRYLYKGDSIPPSLVRHTFRYISSVTSIVFIEDNLSPEIASVENGQVQTSAKVIFTDNKTIAVNNGHELLQYDPIKIISDTLSISFESGPYAKSEIAAGKNTQVTLSETISSFVATLAECGLIKPIEKAISIWPDRHKFAMALTHDIDIVRRTFKGGVRLLWKRHLPGGIPALADSVRSALSGNRNPYDRIGEWIDLEKKLGIKSTFFIFDGNRHHNDDPKYRLEWLEKDIEAILSNGYELALHSSIECYLGDHIDKSKQTIEKKSGRVIAGIRPHYLSAFYPQYWESAAKSGFRYSSALGFDDNIGFMRGIDLPIQPFNLQTGKPVDIIEIPIAIMDCGIIGNNDAKSEEVFEKGSSIIDRCALSGGMVVLDWHERTLYERDYPGWGKLYFRLLNYGMSKGAWFPLMSELADRILKNSRVSV